MENTIGAFDEEYEAYHLTMFFAFGFPFLLILGTILQFLCYWYYNNRFHPFIDLVKDYEPKQSPVHEDVPNASDDGDARFNDEETHINTVQFAGKKTKPNRSETVKLVGIVRRTN